MKPQSNPLQQNLPGNEADVKKELYWQLASGCAEAGDLQAGIDYGSELANLDYSYRDVGTLLNQWQDRLNKQQ